MKGLRSDVEVPDLVDIRRETWEFVSRVEARRDDVSHMLLDDSLSPSLAIGPVN